MKDVSCWCKGLAEKFSFCSGVHIVTVRVCCHDPSALECADRAPAV